MSTGIVSRCETQMGDWDKSATKTLPFRAPVGAAHREQPRLRGVRGEAVAHRAVVLVAAAREPPARRVADEPGGARVARNERGALGVGPAAWQRGGSKGWE